MLIKSARQVIDTINCDGVNVYIYACKFDNYSSRGLDIVSPPGINPDNIFLEIRYTSTWIKYTKDKFPLTITSKNSFNYRFYYKGAILSERAVTDYEYQPYFVYLNGDIQSNIYANSFCDSLGKLRVLVDPRNFSMKANFYLDDKLISTKDGITHWSEIDLNVNSFIPVSDSNKKYKAKVILSIGSLDFIGEQEVLVLPPPNSPPIISDNDKDLGDKNTSFSVAYQINDSDNDALTIVEKLNGIILRTLNNPPKNQDIVINISNAQLYTLQLNQQNTITIQVDDGKGGTSYRNYTFRRTNTSPVISGTDCDLGILTTVSKDYIITDAENNAVTVVEKIDNMIIRSYSPVLGATNTLTISKDTWIQLLNGQHTLSIETTDSNNAKTIRTFTFTKKENRINFVLTKPFQTDIKTSKILVTPSWEIGGATAKIEVCNNGFDVNPTWEDITKQVLINRHYNFTNTTKTADKWGVNIRIYIEKDQASSAEVSIKGFGGAFE